MAEQLKSIPFVPKAAIFDFDDTILDNKQGEIGKSLHELSRLAAIHAVGAEMDIEELKNVTLQQNYDGFRYASEHTAEGGTWNVMRMLHLVDDEKVDHANPILRKVTERKHELHEEILREHGELHVGAFFFIRAIHRATNGKLAIASTAYRRDIDIVFAKSGLGEFFLDERIVCKEQLTRPKPDPQAFDLAFETLGLPDDQRAETVAFEDDIRGIASARGAGLFVAGITTRYTAEELRNSAIPPDIVADSYAEFSQIFNLPVSA